jgi:Na+-transporting NADH:ubiquinone oxidoreductase subunit C
MPSETVRTFKVAFILCVVCSVLVSASAVGLRERQQLNQALAKKKNILIAAGLFEEGDDIEERFKEVQAKIIDLETGGYVSAEKIDPETFNQKKATKNSELGISIPSKEDYAGIKVREKYSFVYLISNSDGSLDQVVLPMNGKGLWSTMYGFLSLDADLNTIRGLTFYEHGETPGLGGEVDNPRWKALWSGKKSFDESGNVIIEVIKGSVVPSSPAADHNVDGLSGATITSRGVTNLLKYWLGPNGFGPYLKRLQTEGANRG